MESTISLRALPLARWRELALPREHGSWSLMAEPLVLGLLVAPTLAGALFASAVAAAFFARRPLRIAWNDARADRREDARSVLLTLAGIAVLGFGAAVALAGTNWLPWLAPSLVAGAVFITFDLRNGGREEFAEIAGAAAFAFLPAAFAAMNGASAVAALAVALVMCGRAVPTVLCVRAHLRAAKTGVRRAGPALAAAIVAMLATAAFARAGLAPWSAAVLLGLLVARAVVLLVTPRPALRARTIGITEAALGALFVIFTGVTWLL